MDIKAYWKAYRAKNRDKINRHRRAAYILKKVNEDPKWRPKVPPLMECVSENEKPIKHLCQRPMCDSHETDGYPVNGRTMFFCIKHQPK